MVIGIDYNEKKFDNKKLEFVSFEIKNAAEKLNSDAMNVNVYIVIISKFIVAIILCRIYIRKNT